MFWPRLGALVLVVLASATSAALATGGKQPLVVTSSLDGKKVLPQMTRWLAHPNVAPADVAEVSFRIDGKVRWVEHSSPYNYASDDEKGHLGYLFTTWLKPGLHRFTVVVKAKQGQNRNIYTVNDYTFTLLDSNRDNRLSRDEYDATVATNQPQASRSRAWQAGYERGIQEGRQAGREDYANGHGWDLEGQTELGQADSGYSSQVGSRTDYQAGYRSGFRNAYRDGFKTR